MLDSIRPTAGPKIVSLPKLVAGGRWRTAAMRSYAQPVLYWFTAGRGRMTVQGVTRTFDTHSAILLPAGTMHGFDTVGPVDGTLLFLPTTLTEDLPDEPVHLQVSDLARRTELTDRIAEIETELDRDGARAGKALDCHFGLLAVWLDRAAQAADGDAPAAPPRACDSLAQAYTSLLELYFRDGHTVADFARALGVTPAHLSRACRAASGRPASALLQDRLHYEARCLLRETRMPIAEVAKTLGFTSHAYFTRAFQARNGMTPSAFRRDH